jgi:5-methylcytosine-specific restriction endonuclease McrA
VLCSAQLDINHIDGNRHNADPSNLEVLCRNCHAIVTVEHEHHKNRYINEVSLNEALWEIE